MKLRFLKDYNLVKTIYRYVFKSIAVAKDKPFSRSYKKAFNEKMVSFFSLFILLMLKIKKIKLNKKNIINLIKLNFTNKDFQLLLENNISTVIYKNNNVVFHNFSIAESILRLFIKNNFNKEEEKLTYDLLKYFFVFWQLYLEDLTIHYDVNKNLNDPNYESKIAKIRIKLNYLGKCQTIIKELMKTNFSDTLVFLDGINQGVY